MTTEMNILISVPQLTFAQWITVAFMGVAVVMFFRWRKLFRYRREVYVRNKQRANGKLQADLSMARTARRRELWRVTRIYAVMLAGLATLFFEMPWRGPVIVISLEYLALGLWAEIESDLRGYETGVRLLEAEEDAQAHDDARAHLEERMVNVEVHKEGHA